MTRKKIGSKHIKLVALSYQDEGQESYRLVEFFNVNKNKDIFLLIPASIIAVPNKLKSLLLENGFKPKVIHENFNGVFNIILGDCDERIVLCNKPGFLYVDNELYYIKKFRRIIRWT